MKNEPSGEFEIDQRGLWQKKTGCFYEFDKYQSNICCSYFPHVRVNKSWMNSLVDGHVFCVDCPPVEQQETKMVGPR